MKSLHYSVVVSHSRSWGFRCEWLGWIWFLCLSIAVNPVAPAIRICIGGLSVWAGRLPKETIVSGKQLLDVLEEKVND